MFRHNASRFTRWLLFLALCLTLALPAQESKRKGAPGRPNIKVWVNTKSGVYHCPGTKWYGKTKDGEYMTQAEAQEKKYRPARKKVCW